MPFKYAVMMRGIKGNERYECHVHWETNIQLEPGSVVDIDGVGLVTVDCVEWYLPAVNDSRDSVGLDAFVLLNETIVIGSIDILDDSFDHVTLDQERRYGTEEQTSD